MKKQLSWLLLFCLLLIFPCFFCSRADAAESCQTMAQSWFAENKGISLDDTQLTNLLKQYFSIREDSFLNLNQNSTTKSGINAAVYNDELTRQELIAEFAERMDIQITDAAVTYIIKENTTEENNIKISVYEWTFYDYDCLGDDVITVDVSGFGTNHVLLVDKTGGNYSIIEDQYSEQDLFGMVSSSYTNDVNNANISDDTVLDNSRTLALGAGADQTDTAASLAAAASTYYSGYDVAAAIKYADTYAMNYNSYYYNFDPLGGDCASFVSQCIAAGGMPMVYGDSGWYYENKDSCSDSWAGATSQLNWFAANRGKLVSSATAADIYPGCPVFYDPDASGDWDHSTICVGTNSGGVPIVDAHTDDRYHYQWNYKPAGTIYATVQLTESPWSVKNFTAQGLDGKIRLSWDALSGADGYYISAMYDNGSSYKTYTTTKTSCNFNNLTNGNTYNFKIRAYVNGEKDGQASNAYSVYSKAVSAVPTAAAVSNLAALTFNQKIRINWEAQSGANGYLITVTYDDGTLYKTYETTKTYCNFTNLTNGTIYHFNVCSYYLDAAGNKTYSSNSDTVTAVPYDDTVKNLAAEEYNQKIRISWNTVAGADGYYIYAMYADGSLYKTYATTKTACNFTKLTNGKTYQFKVREYKTDSSGTRVYGSYGSVVTAVPNIGRVNNLAALEFDQKVRVNWDANSDVSGYKIEVKYSDDRLYKTYETTKTYCNFTSLSNGTQYNFKVCGYIKAADGTKSYGDYCTSVAATPYDDTVQNLQAEEYNHKIRISWDAVSKVSGYYIYAMHADGSLYKTYTTTNTACNFTNLANNVVYQFKVRAYKTDTAGAVIFGAYSETIAAVPNVQSVNDLAALAFSQKVRINWEGNDEVTGYLIDVRYSDDSSYKTYETTKTYCNFTNLSNGTTYIFRVCSYIEDTAGTKSYGPYCTEITAVPYDDTVQNLTAAGSDSKIALSWTEAGKSDGYEIYAMYSDSSLYKTYETTKTTCNFTKLTNNKRYYFQIRTYKIDSAGTKVYGEYGEKVSAVPQA